MPTPAAVFTDLRTGLRLALYCGGKPFSVFFTVVRVGSSALGFVLITDRVGGTFLAVVVASVFGSCKFTLILRAFKSVVELLNVCFFAEGFSFRVLSYSSCSSFFD